MFSKIKQFFSERMLLLKWVIMNAHSKDICFFAENDQEKVPIQTSFFRNGSLVIPEKRINELKSGMDQKSCDTIDTFLTRLSVFKYEHLVKKSSLQKYFTEEERTYRAEWEKEKQKVLEQYGFKNLVESVGYLHHGLRFASEKIKKYVAGKSFIDAGAFIGDSALVLLKYQPKTVISFEMSRQNVISYLKTMNRNHVNPAKYVLVQKGLGSEQSKISYDDTSSDSTTLNCQGNAEAEIISLDAYLSTHKEKIGFIKADVEGFGFEMTKGMVETLKRDRPILSISIYHTPEEFANIKPFIEGLDLNYHFEFQNQLSSTGTYDFVLFAYPNELV